MIIISCISLQKTILLVQLATANVQLITNTLADRDYLAHIHVLPHEVRMKKQGTC